MEFVAPITFDEALDKLGRRTPIGATLTSKEWARMPLALRESALFSSTIESAQFLQRQKGWLTDWMEGAKETLPDGKVALKVGGRAQFIEMCRAAAQAEGIEVENPRDKGSVKDIQSAKRLGLIFDIQTQSAHDHGNWKQGMDEDVLNEFPAQRFIRVIDVTTPRPLHTQNEGAVRLKTDLDFWMQMNSPNIGGFGVPWGPWGFGSGMGVEDVDRDEAESRGLVAPETRLQSPEVDYNARLKASARNLDPELVGWITQRLGDKVEFVDGEVRWRSGQPVAPKPTPPAPKPAPAPVPAPAKPTPPVPVDWQSKLENLASRYDRASDQVTRRVVIEEARKAIEVPRSDRGKVTLTNLTSHSHVKQMAAEGSDLVSRFVRPDLLSPIQIEVRITAGRAFYRDGSINLSVHSDASTAAHEIMHGIEMGNPQLLREAAAFLLRRGGGAHPKLLRDLTGIDGYEDHEIALEDDWVKRGGMVYAGKVYRKGVTGDIWATEILTMGIERLISDPLAFFRRDPDWFGFLIKHLRGL